MTSSILLDGRPTAGESRGGHPAFAGLPEFARVVTRLPSGPHLAELIIDCLDRRLVVVPLGPRTSDRDVTRIAARVQASLVLDGRDDAIRTTALAGRPEHPEADGLAFIMFTSGSTGEPKGVMLDRASVLGNAGKVAGVHDFGPDRPHATCLPLYHVNAAMMSLLGTSVTGAPLAVASSFHPTGYFDLIRSAEARTASIVPALLHRLLEARPAWPESLEYLITAAAPLTSDLAERFYRAYGPRLRQGYGLSEAVNFSFVTPMLSRIDFVDQYIRNHPPVGIALPETEFHLDNGEVVLRAPDRMRGYWKQADATAAVLSEDGWLRTGDLGELRDGLLVLRGRRTEVINRGGEKFYPLDVERQWREAGLSGTFAVVGVVSSWLGEELGLVLDGGPAGRVESLYGGRGRGPVAVRTDGVLVTPTGKPRRADMGRLLVTRYESAARYDHLLRYAHDVASEIVHGSADVEGDLATRLYASAAALVATERPAGTTGARGAAHDLLDALLARWPSIAAGNPPDLNQESSSQVWSEWPLTTYTELIADVVRVNHPGAGPILRIDDTSDASLDDLPAGESRFDAVLVDNVLHRCAEPAKALRRLGSLLVDGGLVVFSHIGSPTSRRGSPWALDLLLTLWDERRLRSRWEWLSMVEDNGFRNAGFSVLRAGAHDLGGVVWATSTKSEANRTPGDPIARPLREEFS